METAIPVVSPPVQVGIGRVTEEVEEMSSRKMANVKVTVADDTPDATF